MQASDLPSLFPGFSSLHSGSHTSHPHMCSCQNSHSLCIYVFRAVYAWGMIKDFTISTNSWWISHSILGRKPCCKGSVSFGRQVRRWWPRCRTRRSASQECIGWFVWWVSPAIVWVWLGFVQGLRCWWGSRQIEPSWQCILVLGQSLMSRSPFNPSHGHWAQL